MARSKATCSIEGCEGTVVGWGYCIKHYRRYMKHGDPLFVQNIIGDDQARFDSKIDRLDNGCWQWTSPPDPDNYGRFGAGGVTYRAHVYAWVQIHGPVPDGMQLDHECHNRAAARGECAGGPSCPHRLCVNPDHLALKSTRENLRASVTSASSINAAKTHCKRGHEFTPENTLWVRNGSARQCITCKRDYEREWQRRHRRP